MYFSNFPKVLHDVKGDGVLHVMTDITRRARVTERSIVETASYDYYDILDGQRPEDIAHDYQDSGDTSVIIELPSDDATVKPAGATAITNYEYEEAQVEKKRRIRLILPQYVSLIKEEFRKSIRA